MEIKGLWRWGGQISLWRPDRLCDTSGVRVSPIPKGLSTPCEQEGSVRRADTLARVRSKSLSYIPARDRQRQLAAAYIASGELYDRKIYI